MVLMMNTVGTRDRAITLGFVVTVKIPPAKDLNHRSNKQTKIVWKTRQNVGIVYVVLVSAEILVNWRFQQQRQPRRRR